MLRVLPFVALMVLLVAMSRLGVAASPAVQAGIARIAVPDATAPFDVLVWYPTLTPEAPWQAGPFTVAASLNAAIVEGERFPVVLLSHGRRGGPLNHRELAARLAREGFIVVAPTHVGDAAGHPFATTQAQVLMDRPRQAIETLDAALQDARFAQHIDPSRVGMIGFSAGGYTALILAGGHPNFVAASAYCRGEGRNDIGSCGPAQGGGADRAGELATWKPVEPRLKALVLMDPAAVLFDAGGLAPIRLPTLLYRPEDDSYMSARVNAFVVAQGLSKPPEQIVVPGRHFVFIEPCPEKLAAEAALICRDGPGVDRVAIHRKIENEVAAFLHAHL